MDDVIPCICSLFQSDILFSLIQSERKNIQFNSDTIETYVMSIKSFCVILYNNIL